MNVNNSLLNRPKVRNRNFRRRGPNVLNIQRPLRKPSKSKSLAHSSSTSSALRWKETSTSSSAARSATTSKNSSSYDADSRIILALCQGRGEATYEVGIAVIDLSKPSLILCQISDTLSYINTLTKINIFNPDEILVPMTFIGNVTSKRLLDKLKEQFQNATITAVGRINFNKVTGMQYVKQLCAPEWNSILIVLQHKYYCLAAAAALLNYAETLLYVCYNKHSLKVEYQESEGFTIIDVSTADNLELVASTSTRADKRYSSLFGILNHCQTRIGARTLRASILQPPCSVPDIESRLDCVLELKQNSNLLLGIQATLSKLANVDQLLTLAAISSEHQETCSDRQLNYILMLNSMLEFINPLKELLEESTQPFFKEFSQTLSDTSFDIIKRLIRYLIHTDAKPARGEQGVLQRCFAIKPDVNGLLDIVRKSYSERLEDMREYVKELGEKYNLPLTLGNNNKKGYHIILTLNQQTKKTFKKSDLNPEFIQIERLSASVTMKTIKLLNYTARIEDIQIEVIKLSNIIIHQLLIELRAYMGLFYKLCEYIARLDMLQSLAQASSNMSNTRPNFNDYTELINARHPLLDYLCDTDPTPNSIVISKYRNIHLITGPNSSGKSIFIRQVLLLQVMAQVGCYVPATKATFRPCDRIMGRVQFNDNMECNASSFVLEVKEMQYFRNTLTENTLIIIDELCRSTAVGEGTALAVAMCEDLAKTSAYVLFATHYIFITNIADIYPNVQNWQMETLEEIHQNTVNLKFTYQLIPGVTTTKKYGLFAATRSWPKPIVDNAKNIFTNFQQFSISAGTKKMDPVFKLKYDLETDLKILKLKGELNATRLTDELTHYFAKLKELGFDVHDEDNIQLTVRTEQASLNNMQTPQDDMTESQQLAVRNFNRSIENMSLSFDPYTCVEATYSQTDSIKNQTEVNEESFHFLQQNTNEVNNDTILSTQISLEFNNKTEDNIFQSNLIDHPQQENTKSSKVVTVNNDYEDPEVAAVIQDVQSLSEYFTATDDEWEVLNELDKTQNSICNEGGKKHILIRSVHIFDKYNNLVDIQVHPPPRKPVLKENITKPTEDNNKVQNEIIIKDTENSNESISYSPLCNTQLPTETQSQNKLSFSFIPEGESAISSIDFDKQPIPSNENSFAMSPKNDCTFGSTGEVPSQNKSDNSIFTFNPESNALSPSKSSNQPKRKNDNSFVISPKSDFTFDLKEEVPSQKKSDSKSVFTFNFQSSESSLNHLKQQTTNYDNLFGDSKQSSTGFKSPDIFEDSRDMFVTPTQPRRKRQKFKTPLRQNQLSTFKPPKALTKQEILTSYRKIMDQYLETPNDEESAAKTMERLRNMPSVEQLRQQKYLAKIRKTDDGIVVIPATEPERKPRKQIPLKRKLSNYLDKTFLSDKNSSNFQDFLKNKKGDTFTFDFNAKNDDLDIFKEKGEVKPEGEKEDELDKSLLDITMSQDGYFRQNQDGIHNILNKYL